MLPGRLPGIWPADATRDGKDKDRTRQHRPSTLAAISGTSGASLAIGPLKWLLRYDDMRRDVAGEIARDLAGRRDQGREG